MEIKTIKRSNSQTKDNQNNMGQICWGCNRLRNFNITRGYIKHYFNAYMGSQEEEKFLCNIFPTLKANTNKNQSAKR